MTEAPLDSTSSAGWVASCPAEASHTIGPRVPDADSGRTHTRRLATLGADASQPISVAPVALVSSVRSAASQESGVILRDGCHVSLTALPCLNRICPPLLVSLSQATTTFPLSS